MRDVFLVDDAGFGHFRIEVVPFTGALPYPGEYGVSAVRLGDVVDELHDDDRLAHAGATEGTDLSSLDEGADEIDDLDARLENVGLGILFEECRGLPVDGAGFLISARPEVVDRIARYVEDPAEDLLPYGYGNGGARIDDFSPPYQSLGGRHGHGPYPVVSQVLLRFQDELLLFLRIRGPVTDLKSIVDLRGRTRGELGVHDGADDLYDFTDFRIFVFDGERFGGIYSAKAAAEISRISWVMAACLARLYWRVRSSMRLPALSVAVFMATMRALCSEASDSRTS